MIGGAGDSNGRGAVWVFERVGYGWAEQGGKLTPQGEIGKGGFGYAVALSADGTTAIISAPADDHNRGAVWVFTRAGSTWKQQGSKLTGGGEVGAAVFGYRVALSDDGNTALVGGPYDDNTHPPGYTGNAGYGAAWVFTRSGSTWKQQGKKLTERADGPSGDFGFGVALSGDGDTALIGAFNADHEDGAAWAFTRTGSVWKQQGGKIMGRGEKGSDVEFGGTLALSRNGNIALIGGPGDHNSVGAVWVLTRSGHTWTEHTQLLTGRGAIGKANFGNSVALSANGDAAVIGGWYDNNGSGAAWTFAGSGSTWTQQGQKLTGHQETGASQFGIIVALSADGATALIGGPDDNHNRGAAWVFVDQAP